MHMNLETNLDWQIARAEVWRRYQHERNIRSYFKRVEDKLTPLPDKCQPEIHTLILAGIEGDLEKVKTAFFILERKWYQTRRSRHENL